MTDDKVTLSVTANTDITIQTSTESSSCDKSSAILYHKNNSHRTSECPVSVYGRRQAPSNTDSDYTWRRDYRTHDNKPVLRDIKPFRPAYDRRPSSPSSDVSSGSKLKSALLSPRQIPPAPAPKN